MWITYEGVLISNNQKLATMLKRNERLLHKENRETVDEFISHTSEFIKTRENRSSVRVNLFPTKINSIFGLERVNALLAPSVSALQNLVKTLIATGKFIDIELEPRQVVRYIDENGGRKEIDLGDRPRVQQIYWTGRYYRPSTTNLRLDSLVFTLKWLADRNIDYEFRTPGDLTVVTLNDVFSVFLCYEYCVSRAVLHRAPISEGWLVVNLHNWNDGPFSKDAASYGANIGATIMNQNELFVFLSQENIVKHRDLPFGLMEVVLGFFKEGYVFGSWLDAETPGDFDIVLVYEDERLLDQVTTDAQLTLDQIAVLFGGKMIHITILSESELVSSGFLNRITHQRIVA